MSLQLTAAQVGARKVNDPPARITSAQILPGSVFDPALFPLSGIIVTDITSSPVRFNRTITGATLLSSALVKKSFELGGQSQIGRFGPKQFITQPFKVASAVSTGLKPTGVPAMSLQIKAARAQASASFLGGIGKFLGGAIKGIGGGPVGIIKGGLGGILGGGRPPPPPLGRPPIALPGPLLPGGGGFAPFPVSQQGPMVRRPTPGPAGALQRFIPGGATGFEAVGCPPGFRPNKTSYFLKDGTFVEKGSRCVRIRRRNSMNPRALSRAISRVESAKRSQKRLGRITIRKKCA